MEDKFDKILEEMRKFREENACAHDKILKSARESEQFANGIEDIYKKWNSFWSVIMTLRNITFTAGFVVTMAYFITELANKV